MYKQLIEQLRTEASAHPLDADQGYYDKAADHLIRLVDTFVNAGPSNRLEILEMLRYSCTTTVFQHTKHEKVFVGKVSSIQDSSVCINGDWYEVEGFSRIGSIKY